MGSVCRDLHTPLGLLPTGSTWQTGASRSPRGCGLTSDQLPGSLPDGPTAPAPEPEGSRRDEVWGAHEVPRVQDLVAERLNGCQEEGDRQGPGQGPVLTAELWESGGVVAMKG